MVAMAIGHMKRAFKMEADQAALSGNSSLGARAVEWIKKHSEGIATIAIFACITLAATAFILASPVTMPLSLVGCGLAVTGLIIKLGMDILYNKNTLYHEDVPTASESDVAPVVEAPVVEAPLVEAPLVEAPVAEVPVAEVPVAEVPVAEVPVAEVPVAEAPVAEDLERRNADLAEEVAVAEYDRALGLKQRHREDTEEAEDAKLEAEANRIRELFERGEGDEALALFASDPRHEDNPNLFSLAARPRAFEVPFELLGKLALYKLGINPSDRTIAEQRQHDIERQYALAAEPVSAELEIDAAYLTQ